MPLKVIKREFRQGNCGFHHDPVDSMVRSQWQSTSKNIFYLIYRWVVAVFVVAVVIIALASHLKKSNIDTFFIYLTRWGITLNMIVGVLGAILVTIWHFHSDFHSKYWKMIQFPLKNNFNSRFRFIFRKCTRKRQNAGLIQNLLGTA